MIADFDDFCLWMYVVVDTFCQHLAPLVRRPGPAPVCSDSELLTLILVGECRSWNVETELLALKCAKTASKGCSHALHRVRYACAAPI